jgi:hypothetical protein
MTIARDEGSGTALKPVEKLMGSPNTPGARIGRAIPVNKS